MNFLFNLLCLVHKKKYYPKDNYRQIRDWRWGADVMKMRYVEGDTNNVEYDLIYFFDFHLERYFPFFFL